MPLTRLPADYFPDRVPITIIDTSSSPEQKPKLIPECQAADAVVPEVFYYAQKAMLHSTTHLFDQEAQSLKPRCVRALKRMELSVMWNSTSFRSDVSVLLSSLLKFQA
ncbi:hypothetical protein ACP70R_018785 [Stipagrostis hirtigluma subsp. patula]